MLTQKQEAFCVAYIETGNASEAYRRAYGCEKMAEGDARYYVYALVCPFSGKVFYIGKGTKHRARQHARDARNGIIGNAPKHKAISAILDRGKEPDRLIMACCDNESDALSVERFLIRMLRDSGLTNISGGSVGNQELASLMAKNQLSKLKSFAEWERTISDRRRAAVVGSNGSLRGYYDDSVRFLERMAMVYT